MTKRNTQQNMTLVAVIQSQTPTTNYVLLFTVFAEGWLIITQRFVLAGGVKG